MVVTTQSGDVKYSTRNVVTTVAITVYGARWEIEISGDHFVKYMVI